jgi:hypothetical protein
MTPEQELAYLRKRCRDLAVAFSNVDAERKFLRRKMQACEAILKEASACLKPYEGQDNVKSVEESGVAA